MSDWIEVSFDSFIRLKRGYDLPQSNIVSGKYPVVASTAIKEYHNTFKANPPGVVTGRSGSIGSVQYISTKYWPLNTTLYVKDFKDNFPKYVYYFLKLMHLENFNSGAGVPTLNQNHLHKLTIKIPPLPIQKKIAAVLSAYDDLIENNDRRIALLEKMAEEIYREWLVRLRFPGHEQVTFHKGIPEGWQVKKIRELVKYYIGGGWGNEISSADFGVGAFVIRGTDLPYLDNGNYPDEIFRFHKISNYKSRKIEAGDIVFEVSGGSKDQLLGRSSLITEKILNFYRSNAICASFCKLMRINESLTSPYFMKYFSKLYYSSGLVSIYQVQSTGISNYQFEDFLSYQTLIMPPLRLIHEFDKHISPIINQKDLLALSNISLKQTRDRLLTRWLTDKS